MTAITVENIVLRDVDPPIIKAAQVPDGEFLIDTRPGRRDGTRPADVVPGPVEPGDPTSAAPQVGTKFFEDDFNSQPDFTSGMYSSERVQDVNRGSTLPVGWDSLRQDPLWSESMGFAGGRESIEILAENSAKAVGGTGKSYVAWRESSSEPLWRWNSDSILAKRLPGDGFRSVYTKFLIKLDPNWTPFGETGTTKLFRISHFNGVGDFYGFGSDRGNGPTLFWDYEATSGGARLNLTTRGFPAATNYSMRHPEKEGWPRQSGPMNFGANIRDLNGDGTEDQQNTLLYDLTTIDPAVIEQMRTQYIDRTTISGTAITSDTPSHAQVWGDVWHQIEFFVQMNTAPGVLDGHLWMWMDQQLVVRNTTMPWIGIDADPQNLPKWNWLGPGGNSHFHSYADEVRRQEWYSVDNFEVWDGIPEGRI